MSVKENMKKFRKIKKFSQKKLADRSGVSYSMICKLESGEQSNPSLETIDKIASALGINSSDLIGTHSYLDLKFNPEGNLAEEVRLLEAIISMYGKETGEVLSNYLHLNDIGKEKASDYIADLSENQKYKK